jgi:trehalose 6-phosphate phosphatase
MNLDPMLAELRADPPRAALLFDVDGTLAPIVADPAKAAVPQSTRDALAALATRYGLVACITGRPAATARLMVGLKEITYAGNHGLEVLDPGAIEPRPDPALDGRERAAAQFVAGLDAAALTDAGLELEDKGPIQAVHWRQAPDPGIARDAAERIATDAQAAGLVPHRGRMVLELRPLATVNKGTATARLVTAAEVTGALFAGDDRTDLDAFAALRELTAAGELERAVCVGVGSAEAPPTLEREADLLVEGTGGLLDLLREL